MPSLSDIPKNLLYPSKRAEFIDWLCKTPTDYGTRRAFVSMWSKQTLSPIPNYEWTLLKNSAID